MERSEGEHSRKLPLHRERATSTLKPAMLEGCARTGAGIRAQISHYIGSPERGWSNIKNTRSEQPLPCSRAPVNGTQRKAAGGWHVQELEGSLFIVRCSLSFPGRMQRPQGCFGLLRRCVKETTGNAASETLTRVTDQLVAGSCSWLADAWST